MNRNSTHFFYQYEWLNEKCSTNSWFLGVLSPSLSERLNSKVHDLPDLAIYLSSAISSQLAWPREPAFLSEILKIYDNTYSQLLNMVEIYSFEDSRLSEKYFICKKSKIEIYENNLDLIVNRS